MACTMRSGSGQSEARYRAAGLGTAAPRFGFGMLASRGGLHPPSGPGKLLVVVTAPSMGRQQPSIARSDTW
jgi:hypothetical protein